MKKINNFIVLILVLLTSTLFAQEKLKGNKEVTIKNRNISKFTKIEIIDNIDVLLIYNNSQSVNIETDSNLQESIHAKVINGTLTLKTNNKILRKKELTAHIKVNKNLKEIYTYNNISVKSKNLLNIDSLTINAFDNSNLDLKINSKIIYINAKKTSDLKLKIVSDDVFIRAEKYGGIKATIDAKNITINTLDKATITLNGSTNNLDLESLGNSTFKGRDLVSKNSIINATNNTNVYINATEAIEIYAKNSAKVYLFSNPKITLTEFFDKASIQKKELDKKLF